MASPATFTDIHPHVIQAHILPRLDGLSLSTAATASSYLRTLCADDHLWSRICNSTWPSITHPRVHHVISTFPAGYRSFFQDSILPPFTSVNHRNYNPQPDPDPSLPTTPYELISAVDIRYQDDIVYSRVEFTNTTPDFLISPLRIKLENDTETGGISRSMNLKAEDLVCADDEMISHLKESVTLNWILIDPIRKRACNLSTIKPVLAWISNDIHLRYVAVLPGGNRNGMVECRIEVGLAMGKGGLGLQVKDVTLNMQDVACNWLNGKEFLVITGRAILEKNNTRQAVVYELKEMGTDKVAWDKKEENMGRWFRKVYNIMPFLSFLLCAHFIFLLFKDSIIFR